MTREDVHVKVAQVKEGTFTIKGVTLGEPSFAEFDGGIVQRKEMRLEAVRDVLVLKVKGGLPDITKASLEPGV